MSPRDLSYVYQGWDGYHQSLVHALEPLTPDLLAYRSHPEMRSVGEIAWHIADGRVDWFRRLDAPGSRELEAAMAARDGLPIEAAAICDGSNEPGRWWTRRWSNGPWTIYRSPSSSHTKARSTPYHGSG